VRESVVFRHKMQIAWLRSQRDHRFRGKHLDHLADPEGFQRRPEIAVAKSGVPCGLTAKIPPPVRQVAEGT
jgi:hypothetical protein